MLKVSQDAAVLAHGPRRLFSGIGPPSRIHPSRVTQADDKPVMGMLRGNDAPCQSRAVWS